MGFALRSFLLATGIQCVSTSEEPTYRFSFQMLRLRRSARTERPRFLGLDPAESPSLLNLCLADSTAGCSLGIHPFQGRSAEGFHRAAHPAILSRASPPLPRDSSDAPQSLSTSDPVTTSQRQALDDHDNPHRVLVPAQPQTFRRTTWRAMDSPHAATQSLLTGPTIFAGRHALPELLGTA